MDKASKAALAAFPKRKDGHARGFACTDDDIRFIYAKGYRKAAKELAITPEDVGFIFNLVREKQMKYNATEACFAEVAKIYNKSKNEV